MENTNFESLLNLLEKGDFSGLKAEISEMNEVDIADFLSELNEAQLIKVFRILPKDISAEVFSYLDSENQIKIVSSITDVELGKLIDESFMDDVVDFLEEVPANVVTRVLGNTDPKTRQMINVFLKYPDNSAGSIMTNEMLELHDRLTVADAIGKIRKIGPGKETVYTAYCIDNGRHLIGTVSLQDLLFAKDSQNVNEIMDLEDKVISVNTLDDQEEVADIVKKYDLIAVPVIDNEKRLVGIITVDDIVDVIEKEATEDFEKMAKVQHSDEGYFKTGVFKHYRNRIVWLMILMVSATFTGKLIDSFEGMLSTVVGLTACIPMLMDTGGNSGNQSSTLIIRGLALGEVHPKDVFRIMWKEVRIAVLCGLTLGVVNIFRMLVFSNGTFEVFLVVSASLVIAVIVAKMIGCTLPLLAKVIHLDPALMAGPMLTTIVDLVTLAIYFSLAKIFLM